MTIKEKLALLEDLFEMDSGSLRPENALECIEGWDSLTKLSLMVLIKNNFEKIITSEEIKGLKTVQDVLDVMEESCKK